MGITFTKTCAALHCIQERNFYIGSDSGVMNEKTKGHLSLIILAAAWSKSIDYPFLFVFQTSLLQNKCFLDWTIKYVVVKTPHLFKWISCIYSVSTHRFQHHAISMYAHNFLLLLFQIINLAWKHKLGKFASFVSLLINCKLSGGRYITIRGTSCKVLVIDIDFEIEDDDEQRQIVTKIHTSHNWWLSDQMTGWI